MTLVRAAGPKNRLSQQLRKLSSTIRMTGGGHSESSHVPRDFAWGTASASYQIEGAAREDGRTPSIWDTFSHTPGKVHNGETGDVAIDSYHRFKEDIDLAAEMGVTHYRFSISWSRILPNGHRPVNPKGVAYYDAVIDYCLAKGIQPFITLYHWDIPQALEDEFGGWLDRRVIEKFEEYAEVVFLHYGDRVKHFLTFNEPLTFLVLGYSEGTHAPGRCSNRSLCSSGDSATECYLAAHHVLLAHARAVHKYRQLQKSNPKLLKGEIGITLNCDWGEPLTDSEADKAAAQRFVEFQMAWFADPIWFGCYPKSMVTNVGPRLPSFTQEESDLLKGSWDFYGLNHYTSRYISDAPPSHESFYKDIGSEAHTEKDGELIGPKADSSWLYCVPWGFNKMLRWVADRYGNPGIFVTENGVSAPGESTAPLKEVLNDDFRVDYYKGYIQNMIQAMADGVKVRGYFAWCLCDNFEWADGFSKRFGLHYVDFNDNLRRYKKKSSIWYSDLIRSHRPQK